MANKNSASQRLAKKRAEERHAPWKEFADWFDEAVAYHAAALQLHRFYSEVVGKELELRKDGLYVTTGRTWPLFCLPATSEHCATLSCELYLKGIHQASYGRPLSGHKLADLYQALPASVRNKIEIYGKIDLSYGAGQDQKVESLSVGQVLSHVSENFITARYVAEGISKSPSFPIAILKNFHSYVLENHDSVRFAMKDVIELKDEQDFNMIR